MIGRTMAVSRRNPMIATRLAGSRRGVAGLGWTLFAGVGGVGAALFAVAPGSLEHKAHLLARGLCAQIPSHTFRFGGQGLPFDARMTGIYGGFLIAAVVLAARGRLRAFRLPPLRVAVVLGLFVVAMGIDGSNSLLLDLGLPRAYQPDNRLRLATGILTGVTLATMLAFVLATTLWREGRWDQAPIGGFGELAVVLASTLPFALLVNSGLGLLFAPLAALLLVAAVTVVSVLMLIVVVLLRGGDRTYDGSSQLPVPATVALVMGVVVMVTFAGGRVVLERFVGVAPVS